MIKIKYNKPITFTVTDASNMPDKDRVIYNKNRQAIISRKRSLMMQDKPYKHLITPVKLPMITGYELSDKEGTYMGYTESKEDALYFASKNNWTITEKKRP